LPLAVWFNVCAGTWRTVVMAAGSVAGVRRVPDVSRRLDQVSTGGWGSFRYGRGSSVPCRFRPTVHRGRASCRADSFACQCCEVRLDGRRGRILAMAANGRLQGVASSETHSRHDCAWACVELCLEHEGEDWERSWHERLSPGDLPGCALMQAMSLSPSLQRAGSWMHVQRPCVLCPGLAVGVRHGGSQLGRVWWRWWR
jgi:hypothetical protein